MLPFVFILACSMDLRPDSTLSSTHEGQTYYIDAINGDDNNSGSQNRPWQTTDKVSSTVFAPAAFLFCAHTQDTTS